MRIVNPERTPESARSSSRILKRHCPMACVPLARFTVKVREIRIPRSADPEADIREVTANIQAQFEAWIREAPGQYMWTNRRFS